MKHIVIALGLSLVVGMPSVRGQIPGAQNEDLKLVPERPVGEPRGWVAFDGDTAVVRSTEACWVFVREGGIWSEQATIPVDCSSLSYTGCRSALSGDTLALVANGPETHVLVRDGDSWAPQLVLTQTDIPFANSLDVEGDTLVVASSLTDQGAPGGGYVYRREGTRWTLEDILVPSGGTDDHRAFGVRISGDTVLVGLRDFLPQTPVSQSILGIFVRDDSGWSEQANFPGFGAGALDGDTMLQGDQVFVREGTTWTEQAVLTSQVPVLTLGFNSSLDGDVAVVGSWQVGLGPFSYHVFQRSGTTWTEVALLEASDIPSAFPFANFVVVGDTVLHGGFSEGYVYNVELPECFLVIGETPGASPFVGGSHLFGTQVGPEVSEAHAVLLDDIPEFALPVVTTGPAAVAGMRGGGGPANPGGEFPAWMADGTFVVQILMWNPEVFPQQPEQWSAGLAVTVSPSGQIATEPFGTAQGGLTVWTEISQDDQGQPVLRFPFSIEGF